MAIANSEVALFGTELSASMTGSFVQIGTVPFPGAIIIFDNQGSVPVSISVDGGTTVWKTFPANAALVLDLSANAQLNSRSFTARQGITFHGNGASGVFSISYIYPKNS